MIGRAVAAGVPFAWFTADETYGQAKWLQAWLEEKDIWYVMAIRCSDTLTTAQGEQRADALIAAIPARAWQKISAGAGAHGPRECHWARLPVQADWKRGRGHWLLARRSLSDPGEIAYYACYGPRRSSTADLAWTAGSRWHVEECIQQAKGEAGLDQYQVRTWRAWYAHDTPARRSASADAKAARKTGPGNQPICGFRGILDHLATLTRNNLRYSQVTIPALAEPTPTQRRAFDLIGAPIPLTLSMT